MKIVFLCGCLEPGRDGVGDYTKRLATELINQGHNATVISLNDTFIREVFEGYEQSNIDLLLLRIPSNLSNRRKTQLVKEWIKKYDPDWISLQFVIYAYHAKGLPFKMNKFLADVGEERRRWHIMFHEIWIGFSRISSFKHKTIGWFQKLIIASLVKTLKPRIVTTSNILYRLILKSNGIASEILPLFSNIDISPRNEYITSLIMTNLGIQFEDELSGWKLTGIFGNLYPDTNLKDILDEQLVLTNKQNLRLAFVSFGRISDQGMSKLRRLDSLYAGKIKFIYLNEQSPENVSGVMQMLQMGISCTPAQFIGKSGVFAVMKLHGLDVVIPSNAEIPEYEKLIFTYNKELAARSPDKWTVERSGKSFINLLEEYS